MTIAVKKEKTHYSWEDYKNFPGTGRWEIIAGEIFDMAPAPSVGHQRITRELTRKLSDFFDKKKCEVLTSPIDVKLSDDDIVQPDLLIVCEKEKIKDTHIEGAPTVMIEIISKSSHSQDRFRKALLYAKFGVKEYWIVTPEPPLVELFSLDGDSYRLINVYDDSGILKSPSFEGLEIKLKDIFGIK